MNESSLRLRRCRERPVLVDAVRVTVENIDAVADWCDGRKAYLGGRWCIMLGDQCAELGEFIVRDPAFPGSHVRMTATDFRISYEVVDASTSEADALIVEFVRTKEAYLEAVPEPGFGKLAEAADEAQNALLAYGRRLLDPCPECAEICEPCQDRERT